MATRQEIADPHCICKWNASNADEEVMWPEKIGAREMPKGVLHPIKQEAPLVHSSAHKT